MSPQRVLIIGCGVAGPVVALLLKRKGYEPVVLEKVRELGDVGGSLMMMPNGLKVLSLLGLANLVTDLSPHLEELRDETSSGDVLGFSSNPAGWAERYGQPACGVKRTTLNLALKSALLKEKIQLHEGWRLKHIVEGEQEVTAISEDGRKEVGDFLIGCDGIKSVSRPLVLAKHGLTQGKAGYTGLTQTRGISPTPSSLKSHPVLLNVYGPGAHFVCYPISPTLTSWAISQRDLTEAQETWHSFAIANSPTLRDQLAEQFKDWSGIIVKLIGGADRLIKYGLYDRPQLEPEQWYRPRCVLIGDAAHPTSPHLGQGANQALEDCYHLCRLLPECESESAFSSAELSKIFGDFARMRQPRTAALVEGARAQGEDRVVGGGSKACEERNERLRQRWVDEAGVVMKQDYLLMEPFAACSEDQWP